MASFFIVLSIFIGLFITQEIFHRYPKFSFIFFIVASIILFPCWVLLIGIEDWFPFIKVFSIASGIMLLSLFRTTRLGKSKLMPWITYIFLVVNIFEATMRDIVHGDSANYLNAFVGILLIATIEKINTIHIDKRGDYKDLHWSGMTLSWIIGYTIWNWVFVYLNYGFQSSLAHIAVLGSALVIGLIDRERWLQARVFTLGTFFIIFHSFPHRSSNILISEYNKQFGLITALIAIGFMLIYTAIFIRRTHKNKLMVQ